MGFSIKDFLEDSEDFFTDDIPEAFKKFIMDELVKDSVKYARLRFQVLAIKAVNAGEDAVVASALDELKALGIPTEQIEAIIRKTYWQPLELVKKATGADWLIDT